MPERHALTIEVRGERFRFYADQEAPETPHITVRHGVSPEDAIRTFFSGVTGPFDEAHARFETVSSTHQLLWTRHAYDGSVVVISCWRLAEE